MTDADAEREYGEGWRAPDTIPRGEAVEALTVRGLRRVVRHPLHRPRWIRREGDHGPRRVRVNVDGGRSAVMAVAWRPVEQETQA